MKPIPSRFDRLFKSIGLALNRYVEIIKPIVLIAAQTARSAGTIHNRISMFRKPRYAVIAPKRIRLGMEISNGARAIPSAYDTGRTGIATIISRIFTYLSHEIS